VVYKAVLSQLIVITNFKIWHLEEKELEKLLENGGLVVEEQPLEESLLDQKWVVLCKRMLRKRIMLQLKMR